MIVRLTVTLDVEVEGDADDLNIQHELMLRLERLGVQTPVLMIQGLFREAVDYSLVDGIKNGKVDYEYMATLHESDDDE
jgi:hypothetical protein